MTLKQKNILITGATRGLGLCIVEKFITHGANVILVARDAALLTKIQKRLLSTLQAEQAIKIIPTDLSDQSSLLHLIMEIPTLNIDVLINNAATQYPMGPAWETQHDDYLSALQINLLAPIMLANAMIKSRIDNITPTPRLMGANGKIINISGGGASMPRPHFSAYATAKAGLVRFTETLAAEVKQFNIAVNCIAPGSMPTDLQRDIIKAGKAVVGEKEFQQAASILNKDNQSLMRATELCLYLASAVSDGITGKLISAQWDAWQDLSTHLDELDNSDIYTLRRIVPKDRGKEWGNES